MSFKEGVKAGYTIVKDANLQGAAKWLNCQMGSSSDQLQQSFALATQTHPRVLKNRQTMILTLREHKDSLDWSKRFEACAALEKDLTGWFLKKTSDERDDLEADAVGQLSFQHPLLKPVNHIPFFLTLVAMFKIWLVPAMTLATPLLTWILPYILLKFVYTLPISHDQYAHILQHIWSGDLSRPPSFGDALPSVWTPRSFAQMAIFVFSFAQSMIQPIQNAMHLYTVDSLTVSMGKKLVELQHHVRQFREDLNTLSPNGGFKLTLSLEELGTDDPRRNFALLQDQPERLRILLQDLARLEILWQIAQKDALQPTRFVKDIFLLKDATDISLPEPAAASDLYLKMDGNSHGVLTGPNGGGKSSYLRAILQCVLFSHAYGFAACKWAQLPRFLWIASGLQLRDTPGKYSMFETEVKFAADVLRMGKPDGPGLVLFDELFHSTNPPDGIRTAELFLKQLWAQKGVFSVVSTHVFSLVEGAPEGVIPVCCPATELPGGEVKYEFRARPGICKVSSVHTIWERFGLAASAAPAAPAYRGKLASPISSPSKRTEDAE
jgi:hypothetical protein